LIEENYDGILMGGWKRFIELWNNFWCGNSSNLEGFYEFFKEQLHETRFP
jgi:hypothetical protein